MEKLSAIEFDKNEYRHDIVRLSNEAMESVEFQGAAAIHNFGFDPMLGMVAGVLNNEQMFTDVGSESDRVKRHQDLVKYHYTSQRGPFIGRFGVKVAPVAIRSAASNIEDFISQAEDAYWKPNEIVGHRYNIGDYISRHRDLSKTALNYVALLTVEGEQDFYVQTDNDQIQEVHMRPGTLTLMRGYNPRSQKPRPYHWVAPARQRRLAVSLRQSDNSWD